MVTASINTVTPLTSAHAASFAIAGDGVDAIYGGGSGGADSSRIEVHVESRSVHADSNKDPLSHHHQHTKGEWSIDIGSKCSLSSAAMLACCPCIPAANIHNMLGSSFETGILYFGGLLLGMLISLGLSLSNNRAHSSSDSAATLAPVPTTNNTLIYGYIALVLLAFFLVGVSILRTKTRHRFNIPGHRVFDCLLSLACCWCVLSQAQSHIGKHNRHEFGLESPSTATDTLPAYV